MEDVKHPVMVIAALAACCVVGAGAAGGALTAAGAAAVVVVVLALGWPQLLGAPARTSLTLVLALTGALASAAVIFWPDQAQGRSVLLEPVAMCLALGAMAAFLVQLVRGMGRPYRLESTAGTITGVAVACTAAGWVALGRLGGGVLPAGGTGAAITEQPGALAVSVAASLAAAVLVGALPLPGLWAMVLAIPVAGAVPLAVSGVLPWLPLPAAVLAGALAALVALLITAVAPHGRGRPVGNRAALALAVAPVALAGLVAYFVLRIMPV